MIFIKKCLISIVNFYLLVHWIAVVFVTGGVGSLVILDADLLVGCGTLFVRHVLVDLLTLLFIDSGADIIALCLVLCLVSRAALFVVDRVADLSVDIIADRLTLGGCDGFMWSRSSWKSKGSCQETKAD